MHHRAHTYKADMAMQFLQPRHTQRFSSLQRFALFITLGSALSIGGAAVAQDLSPRLAASAPTFQRGPASETAPPSNRVSNAAASVAERPKLSPAKNADNTEKPVEPASVIHLGTGVLVAPASARPRSTSSEQPVSLSFENGDVREIVKNIIGDLLGENYIIHPSVQGTITMRTAKPVPRSNVLGLLETILRANNFALVRDGDYWRILPATETVRGVAKPQLTLGSGSKGAVVLIYPVKHVGAKELARLLEPFARDPAATLRVDDLRNFLFISGPGIEVERLSDVADMFDVNLMAGMSFALVPIKNSDVKSVVTDYEKIVGGATASPLVGLLRVIPIERMNSVLLISARAEIVQEAKDWIEKLDIGGDAGSGQKLFVYELKFTQAEKMQPVLQSALGGRSLTASATVAPGQTTSTIGAPANPIPGQAVVQAGNSTGASAGASRPAIATSAANQNSTGSQRNTLTITADKDRNSLLILATQAEYNAIESVIRRLDVAPKQVAIDVQIAEVSLNGDFQFGLQSYFQGKLDSANNRMTSANGLGQIVGGVFTYTWKKSDAIKAILNLSETKKQVRTIAQPTLITLENQKATFTSGTQISVRTQSSSATTNTAAVDSFQYINTGISLNVTPRVSGENVFLEIQQEISDAGVVASGSTNNPDITKRSASTNVMVSSGDTMLMGGLFQEGSRRTTNGLPVVSSIPVVGGLFGGQTWQSDRTELVLLITPRVLTGPDETREAVDEIRRRMESIETLLPKVSTKELPSKAADKTKLSEQIRALNGSLTIERSLNSVR